MRTKWNASTKRWNNWRNTTSIILVVAMLLYALPHLNFRDDWTLFSVFGMVWIVFALFIVAAHLHHLLRVDKETEQRMRQVKQQTCNHFAERMKRQSSR